MEEYEKQILANDLCGRLGHDVVVRVGTAYDIANNITEDGTLKGIEFDDKYFGIKALVNVKTNSGSITYGVDIEDVKPYLRPMSSMSSKEWVEFCDCSLKDETSWVITSNRQKFIPVQNREDYLNSKHFDYRGLIKKGLALKAPKDMYNF